jgi:hypothetical protein
MGLGHGEGAYLFRSGQRSSALGCTRARRACPMATSPYVGRGSRRACSALMTTGGASSMSPC